jgi:Ca2+-binding RTX toxin-like protein
VPTYSLELELFSVLNASTSDFEIWTDGSQLGGGYTITSSGSSLSIGSISYGGSLPTSLEFRFDDGNGATIDQIEIRSVKINDRYVNTGNYLSTATLNDGASSNVNITNADFIFNNAAEPPGSEFTTGATQTFTAGADTFRSYLWATPEIFDALAGDDDLFLSQGNDKVAGGAGNDYIRGFGGDDLLSGGADDDIIGGDAGNDEIYGGTGNDRLRGGTGNDELHGGDGDDRLSGNAGNDTLTGGIGNDQLGGGAGNDILYGDAGNDILIGAAGADTLDGGAGNDLLYGGAGIDHIDGDDGDDRLIGDSGNDVINGGAGQDEIYGGADNDSLYGGAGQDEIYGGAGVDIIEGGAGIDNLYGGTGDDTIYGGDDRDQIIGGEGGDIIYGGEGDDQLSGDLAVYEYSNGLLVIEAENFTTNTTRGGHEWELFTDTNASADTAMYIDNNGANDNNTAEADVYSSSPELTYNVNFASTGTYYVWVRGRGPSGSDDSVHVGFNGVRQTDNGGITGFNGGSYQWGNTSTSGPVATFTVSAVGENTINLWMREDGVYADKILITDDPGYTPTGLGPAESGQNSSVGGDDTIYGGNGNDIIDGDIGNDLLNGEDGDDTIYGGAGQDIVNGGDGDDTIFSGSGNNTVSGGNDNDVITGGSGVNLLNGDAGDDVIYSNSVANSLTTILSTTPEARHIGDGWIVQTHTAVGTISWTPHADVADVYYLVVGGGGGGGGRHGGGGGGGGLVTNWGGTAYSVTTTPYTITVGDGGSFTQTSPTNQSIGQNGQNSVFDSVVALGGGGGGSYTANNTDTGGSGGGGGGVGPTTGGSGDGRAENRDGGLGAQTDSGGGTGYGNDGGTGAGPGATAGNTGGGGGGGAGTAGSIASGANGGNGGDGFVSDITGKNVYYAGGGGGGGQTSGGTGGLGGGGNGSNNTPTPGVDGLGGGGGGARSQTTSATGADGGSGTVILRYQLDSNGGVATLAGGAGNDTLNGGAGLDVFKFSHTGAANVDTINSFLAGADQLDLSDLLTGYDPMTDLITDFIQITDSGANSDLRVDTTGSGSFGATTVVATITGVTGLTDETALISDGTFII